MRPVHYTWTAKDALHAGIPRPNPYPTDTEGVWRDINDRGISPFLFLPELLPGCKQYRVGEIVWLRLQRSPMPYTVTRYDRFGEDVVWQVAPDEARGVVTVGDLCAKMLALSEDASFKDRAKYARLYDGYKGGDKDKDELALSIFEHWENTGIRYVITRWTGWSWELVKTPQKLPATVGGAAPRWRVPTRLPPSAPPTVPVVPNKPAVKKVPSFPQPFTGCTPTQRDEVKIALQGALDDLDKAIAEITKMSGHAKDALWLAFRDYSSGAAKDVLDDLKKIRAGLPTANICCQQKGMGQCKDDGDHATLGYTDMVGMGSIHLCVGALRPGDYTWTIIHEGAHRFANKLGRPLDIYFGSGGDESEATYDAQPWFRKRAADADAAVTYHLAHRTASEAAEQVRLYSGGSVTHIVQGHPHGTIELGAEKPNKPLFIVLKCPLVHFGFTFQWYLIDVGGKVYPMDGSGGLSAFIPKETRDQLRAGNIGFAEVRCQVTVEQVGGPAVSKLLSLRVYFK